MHRVLVAVFVTASAIGNSSSLSAGTLAAGDWRGGSEGARGQAWCWLGRTQPDQSELRFTLHRSGRFAVMLRHPRAMRLPRDQYASLDLAIDSGPAVTAARFVAVGPDRIVAPAAGAVLPALQAGRSLRVGRGGDFRRFDLAGTKAAIAALRRCRHNLP